MKRIFLSAVLVTLIMSYAQILFAHCEVPCGIYGDKMRFDMITEHITTVEKSMTQIAELSAAEEKNYNQIVRWINNKDEHATEIQHIISQYFLTQRIKPVDGSNAAELEKYNKHLGMLHEMLVYAMKSKQTIDTSNVSRLRELTEAFRASYLGPEGEAHQH